MATSKMFVHYSGTKSAFIAAGLPSQYTNKIVFIQGGENGTGACVYTHGNYYANVEEALAALKYFSSISANGTTATAAGPNGTINFTADDPAAVSVKVDSTGVHFGLTDEFKAAVNTTIPNRIKAIEDDYLKGADKTELQGSIASTLAEAKGYTDSEVSRIVADSGSGLIGSAEDSSDKNTIYGTKKYAEEQADAAQEAAEATAAADATSKVNAAKEELNGTISTLEGRVAANENAIGVLNGEGEGSVKKAIDDAINKFATDVTDDEVVNSYKELIDYAAEHGAEFTTLVGEVAANKTAAEEGIAAAKADAAAAQGAADAAQDTADDNSDRLAAIEADYLKNADKETLQAAIDLKVARSEYDAKMEELEAKNAELEGMWEWEEL